MSVKEIAVEEITVEELKAKLDSKQDFFLLDVREEFEREICSLGGELIPLADLEDRQNELPRDKEIVVYCRIGGRSYAACELLLASGFQDVVNLKGGVLAWSDRIDSTLKKY